MTLLPRGIAGRFSLLLAIALVAANLVALGLIAHQGERFDARASVDRELARIVGLVSILETTPPEDWGPILRRAGSRSAEVASGPVSMAGSTTTDRLSRGLSERLGELTGREVRVAVAAGPGRRGGTINVSVALELPQGPAWLNIRVARPDGAEGPAPGLAMAVILGLSLVAVLGVGLVFLRGLTRPLQALEDAAAAAGQGDRTVRVPVTGAREVQAVATAFNDMQDRIAAFEAERLRMVGAVGHDLRTPITSLRIRAEMLDDPAQREAMVATLDEMAVMADGLVSYARSGSEAEPAGLVDLRPLVARLAAERGAAVLPGPDAQVRGRPVALGRAFGNLIDNAMRYGGSARIELAVEGGNAVVSVSDDGPGLPEDRLAAVFDPFVRGDDSRSSDTGGAGLGLSIARTIVEAHGGTIGLANRQPRGLVATARLPLAGGH